MHFDNFYVTGGAQRAHFHLLEASQVACAGAWAASSLTLVTDYKHIAQGSSIISQPDVQHFILLTRFK